MAVARADERLRADGLAPLPERLTLHGLRRTCASLLIALGRDPVYVMSQMGHTDPNITLGLHESSENVTQAIFELGGFAGHAREIRPALHGRFGVRLASSKCAGRMIRAQRS